MEPWSDNQMRIGIVSDTHDDLHKVRQAVEIFKAQGLECVLHAGDITGPSTISLFARLSGARVIAVYGNCDSERMSLRSAVEAIGGQIHDRVYTGQIDDRAIYMTHVPHGIEVYRGKPILYSLGNLIFGSTMKAWADNILAELVIDRGRIQGVLLYPVAGAGEDVRQPWLLDGTRADDLLGELQLKSAQFDTGVVIRDRVGIVGLA